MAETQIYAIGTSGVIEVRSGGQVEYSWGSWGSWKTFPNAVKTGKTTKPTLSKSKVKKGYSVIKGSKSAEKTGTGNKIQGMTFNAKEYVTIDGASQLVDMHYQTRDCHTYKKSGSNHMIRKTYKPYQYRKRYKSKPSAKADYIKEVNNIKYICFDDYYYINVDGQLTPTPSQAHLLHPQTCEMTYKDVKRNLDTSNSVAEDGRDNQGSAVLSYVRTNVATFTLAWNGLSAEEGANLLSVLNPSGDTTKYISIQYRDYETNKVKVGLFLPGERKVKKYPNGTFEEISVTLEEA